MVAIRSSREIYRFPNYRMLVDRPWHLVKNSALHFWKALLYLSVLVFTLPEKVKAERPAAGCAAN